MGKVAFVFPGQGAQYAGMGLSLYENSSAARSVFNELDRLLPGTSALCFYGSEGELSETKNTQPCMFACELAAAYALKNAGIFPDMTAGFSLGEIAALTFAGSVTLAYGFYLVTRRGRLMQSDAEKKDSAMAAVLKLESEEVAELCGKFQGVYPANFSCPGQVTVAALKDSLEPFCEAVRAAGGRAVTLKVRGGFHSPLMGDAAKGFGQLLEGIEINKPSIPLYSNYTGLLYENDFKTLLSQQISNPVRWEAIVRNMIESGADTFFEVGPGSVLSGLIKKIDPSVKIFCVGTYGDLNDAIKEYEVC